MGIYMWDSAKMSNYIYVHIFAAIFQKTGKEIETMKVTKRILAIVMSLLMILSTCAVAASAAGTLQALIDAAGDTVTMSGDTIESVVINKDLTLDLGGYELRGVPGSPAITVNGANVTITNGRVVSQFADVKSLTMMEKVVDESPAAILVNGGSVTVEGVRAMGGLTRVPTTSNRFLPTGNAIALLDGATATVTQSSLVGRYGVNNKVTNNPAGGTVTINDAIMLGFMRAVKDSSKEILGDTTEKENVADHIEGFLSKGVKLEDRERNMLKRVFAERAIVYTKAVDDNATFAYNECLDKYVVTAHADESNLWGNNTSTDCSYKYVPEYVVLADGTLIEMTEDAEEAGAYVAQLDADQIDGIQIKYRTWFDMQPDVKEMADNFEPYLQAVVNDAINGVNKLYAFSLEKYTTYTQLVGNIAKKLDMMGNEMIGGKAIRDIADYQQLRRAIYDLGGKTVWEAVRPDYEFGDSQMEAIYGAGAVMPADGIVGTIDRVAKLKGELETFLPFEDQSKWADLAYWAYENYDEVLDIVDEAVERLAALQEILDRDIVKQLVEKAGLQEKRAQFDKVQKITNDGNAVLDRLMASSTVQYFIQKADTHKSELKPYVNKFIGIYNNLDRYFVPADFMDGNFAKGYAVYGIADMDSDIQHVFGEPEWEWADDYSEATATFTCENCSHEETVTDLQPVMNEVTAADCENDQVVTYTATVLFRDEEYTDTTDEVAGPETATDHDWGEPEWEWADDYSSATATFVCGNNSEHTQTLVADIDTSIVSEADCENDKVVIYTATVNFENERYTDSTDEIVLEDATGHNYGDPVWEWAPDYSEATATFTCQNDGCGHQENVTDTQPVENEISALDCVTDHVVTYTATVEFEDETYTDTTEEVTLEEADGHVYGDPVAVWADDFSSVTVTFTCEQGDDEQTFVINDIDCEELEEAECEKDQVVQYLASLDFNGEIYDFVSDPTSVDGTATGHSYGDPDWEWADDYSSATATFTCQNDGCNHTETVTDDAPVMNEVTPATCEDDQVVTYTATVEFEDETYTDTTDEVAGPDAATGHSYGDPDWEWADDYSSATATFTCQNDGCNHTETVTDNAPVMNEVTPATCEDDQVVTYTATVEFEDETYTDTTDEVVVPDTAPGHNFGDPVWSWADDYSSATATFTCQNDGCTMEETLPADIDATVVQDQTCTNDELTTYTATVMFGDVEYTDTTDPVKTKDATDHNFGEWEDFDEENHIRYCQNAGCDASETEAHAFTEWTVVTEPTETTEGKETRTCTICGREESRPIDKLPPLLLYVDDSTEGANVVRVTVPYGRRGTTAFNLSASEEDVTYTIDQQGSRILSVDENGKVTYKRLCLFCDSAVITATTPDGRTATCEVNVKMKWWQIIIWFMFGSLWY